MLVIRRAGSRRRRSAASSAARVAVGAGSSATAFASASAVATGPVDIAPGPAAATSTASSGNAGAAPASQGSGGSGSSLGGGAIAGIVVGSVVAVAAIIGLVVFLVLYKKRAFGGRTGMQSAFPPGKVEGAPGAVESGDVSSGAGGWTKTSTVVSPSEQANAEQEMGAHAGVGQTPLSAESPLSAGDGHGIGGNNAATQQHETRF